MSNAGHGPTDDTLRERMEALRERLGQREVHAPLAAVPLPPADAKRPPKHWSDRDEQPEESPT